MSQFQPPNQWGQQPQYQPPPTYAPPPQFYPYQEPPQPPQKRPSFRWLWITALIIVVSLVSYGLVNGFALPSATQPTSWHTTHTFTGNGASKTALFTVPAHWQLAWSCNPSSWVDGPYNVIVHVERPDGTPADLAVNTFCKSDNTGGTTDEYVSGSIYLFINSEAEWTVQILEPQ